VLLTYNPLHYNICEKKIINVNGTIFNVIFK
jgi:hypothetical protein